MEKQQLKWVVDGDQSLLVFSIPSELAHGGEITETYAIPIQSRRGGMLLALPMQALDNDKLIEQMAGEGEEMIGPSKSFVANLLVEDEAGESKDTGVSCRFMVVDMTDDVLFYLRDFDSETDDPMAIVPYDLNYPMGVPDLSSLPTSVKEWASGQQVGRANFYSAREEPEDPVPVPLPKKAAAKRASTSALAEQLALLAQRVESLAEIQSKMMAPSPAVAGPKDHGGGKSVAAQRMPSLTEGLLGQSTKAPGLPSDIVSKAAKIAGPPPKVRAPIPTMPSPGDHLQVDASLSGGQDPVLLALTQQSTAISSLVSHLAAGDSMVELGSGATSSSSSSTKGVQRRERLQSELGAGLSAGPWPNVQANAPSQSTAQEFGGASRVRPIHAPVPRTVRRIQEPEGCWSDPLVVGPRGGLDAGGELPQSPRTLGADDLRTGAGGPRPGRLVGGFSSLPGRGAAAPALSGQDGELAWPGASIRADVADSVGCNGPSLFERNGNLVHKEVGDNGFTSGSSRGRPEPIAEEETEVSKGPQEGGRGEVRGLSLHDRGHEELLAGPDELVCDGGALLNEVGGSPCSRWEEEMSFSKWCALLTSQVLRTRSKFSFCLRATFSLPRSSSSTPTTLFPIPSPPGDFFGRMTPGTRGSSRWRIHHGRVVHLLCMALNYWHFGGTMPSSELLGREPSPVHTKLYARLRSWLKSECRSSTFVVAKAGRRFPQLVARLCELSAVVTKHGIAGDPYSRDFPGVEIEKDDDAQEELRPYRSLDPSRLVLHGRGHCDITSFLPDELCMVYREPDLIRLNRTPMVFEYPRMSDSKQTVAHLARIWDENNLLRVHDDASIELHPFEKVKVFNAMKSSLQDRQIGDRRGRNAVEARVQGDSVNLPSGVDLLDIMVSPREECLWIYASDRKDFYHQIWTSARRSRSNTLGPALDFEDLKDTGAMEDFLKKKKVKYDRAQHGDLLAGEEKKEGAKGGPYYAAFGAVLQGDHAGVDMATSAHVAALQSAGCLSPDTRMVSSAPPRSSRVFEGVVIDDYYVVGVEDNKLPAHRSAAAHLHSKSQGLYERLCLLGSPQKDLVAQKEGRIIGAHVDASERTMSRGYATVGSPPEKRYSMSWLALQVSQLRCTSDALHLAMLGGIVSMLMYRRPLMSILAKSFALVDMETFDADHPKVVPLPRTVVDELVLLAVLTPLFVSNIAADFCPKVFCSDASLERGAVLEAPISQKVARVLHRSLKSKGAYTKLHYEEEDFAEDGPMSEAHPSPERPWAFYYDFIEIFAGSAGVTKCMAARGWNCGPPLDISWSEEVDLTFVHVASWISFMVCAGRLLSFMVEPVCTTFSVMRRPALRSRSVPFGFSPHEAKTRTGNILAMRAFQFLYLAAVYFIPAILENPNSSLIKNLPGWKIIEKMMASDLCRSDSCQFGSPHQKPFKFLGVHVDLQPLRRRCQCKGPHLRVEGKYTKSSASYTPELADTLAQVLSSAILAMRPKEKKEKSVGHENLLVNEVMKSSSWSIRSSWAFKHQKHINVLELEALLRLVSSLAFERTSTRIVAMVDSLVTRGAACKGRSSSFAISNVLRRICSTVLAADLYVTIPFVPTRLNTSDDPTRLRSLRQRSRGLGIDDWEEDQIYDLASRGGLKKPYANWNALMIGLLGPAALRLSDRASFRSFPLIPKLQADHASMDFDSSLGFPGEGPVWIFFVLLTRKPVASMSVLFLSVLSVVPSSGFSAMAMPIFPRNPADAAKQRVRMNRPDLVPGRRVTEVTTSLRQVLMTTFRNWLCEERVDWDFLMQNSHSSLEEINAVLTRFGRVLYQSGRPLQHYSETINAVVADRPHLRRSMQSAWNLAFGWNQAEPSAHHLAIPSLARHVVSVPLLEMVSICRMPGSWMGMFFETWGVSFGLPPSTLAAYGCRRHGAFWNFHGF